MPDPHHAFWDRLTFGNERLSPSFDRPLPLIGALGRRVRKRRRGIGYALGNFFRQMTILSRTPIGSPRFAFIIRRRWRGILLPLLYLGVLFGSLSLVIISGSKWILGLWIGYMVVASTVSNLRQREIERWPLFSMRMRRRAILYSSPRFRRLHPESGDSQTPEQIARYLNRRRADWTSYLAKLKFSERQALVYREHPWVSFFPFIFLAPLAMPLLATGTPASLLGLSFPIALVMFYVALFGLPAILGRRLAKKLTRCLEHHDCPDCGYPLDDFSTGSYRDQPIAHLGPARCNECGVPWPLLPPPVPKPPEQRFKSFRLFRQSKSAAAPPPAAAPPHSSPAGSHPPAR